ncbi:coiled-coil domain-containing protein 60 isoform X2 [Opisthocomus hoazin]|uniref:coiled-coil domain-containing protein 60 isoform X2 n=1 Tax=Opisthocomus hoazin TaxID=30419 RepID=UPI003F53E3F2
MPVSEKSKNWWAEKPAAANKGGSSRPEARGAPKILKSLRFEIPVAPNLSRSNRNKVLAATEVLNPRDFVCIQALPGFAQKEGKVLARSRTVYRSSEPPREQVFWENYYRRQKQFTQGHFTPAGKPYQELGEILYTDPKELTLHSLGQLAQCDPPEPVKRLSPFRETGKKLRTLTKALSHSRHHINSVKQGGEYFDILHQESLERKNTLKTEQQAQGTGWRSEFQPPKYCSDAKDSEEEINICSLTEGNHLRKPEKKEKKMTLRSFAPVYTSVLIPSPPGAKSEHLFRQLCAIHWLLEALTLESNGSKHSIFACWNPMDPGGCKKTVKEIKEEKLARYMWKLFTTNTKKYTRKARYSPLKKINKTSISQLSNLSSPCGQTPYGSETSTVLCSEDNVKINVASSDVTTLQKVTQMIHEEVSKDVHKQEKTVKKTGLQRRQEERCCQKFQALKQLKYSRKDMERLRQLGVRPERERDEDGPKWFPVLLARLPESVKSDHYVQKILKKLEKYDKTRDLKIHPDTFLKALANLQVWELCSPEIAAAVEFVRESVVQMPEEDFSEWFQERVDPSVHSPPPLNPAAT